LRRLVFIVTLTCIGAAAAPAFADCGGAALASGRASVDVDGQMRSFIVRVASGVDGRTAAPVVLAFHPFGMNADYMATRVPLARAWRDAIVIYPNALPRGRGTLVPSWQSGAGDSGDRDLRLFDVLLAWVREHGCVDDRRVFALGYSNGAQFAYLLACERASAIAGVALASGQLPCRPRKALPVVINHGTGDSTIPYASAISAAGEWSRVNGCKAPPKPEEGQCVAAMACGSAPLTLCTYDGGHEYDVSFTTTAAEFFKKIGPAEAGPYENRR
jgi:polyhydroxybutyrate depolymerase